VDETVVVTGASTGIGEACALHLDRLGFRVLAGVRKAEDGEALRKRASDRFRPVLLDVTDGDSIARAAREVGPVAGLVNNAGIVVAGPLEFLPLDDLRRQLEVNVIGQVAVTQAFLPALRAAKGRVVNIGSVSGLIATPFLGPYCASKFALEALTDSLRMELRPRGIRVSIVEPGAIATPIWEKSRAQASRVAAALPESGKELYATALARMDEFTEALSKKAIPAAEVARAVEHALTARRPKRRYLLGRRTRFEAGMFRLIPERWRDGVILRALRLPDA